MGEGREPGCSLRVQQAASRPLRSLSGPQSHRGPEIEKNRYHAIRDGFYAIFSETTFCPVGPHVVGNRDLVGFSPVSGLGEFRARAGNRKTQFPGSRGPETGEKVTTLSEMGVRNSLTVYILTDQTPRAGKHEIRGFCLWHEEIPGPGRKRKIAVAQR